MINNNDIDNNIRFANYLNLSISADSMFRLATRWFMWRMEMLALTTVLVTAVVCVALKGSVSPATAGLALSNVFISATFIAIVMRFKAEFKAFVTSLERSLEYLNLPQEAPAVIEGSRIASKNGAMRIALRMESHCRVSNLTMRTDSSKRYSQRSS